MENVYGVAGLIGFTVSLIVLIRFFELASNVGAIRKGMITLEGHAAEQTRYLAAISTNVAKWVRESPQSSVDGPKP